MEKSIIEQVFFRNFIITTIVVCALAGIFILVRYAVENGVWPNWSYLIWSGVTLVIVVALGVGLANIYLDIKEESYITYNGIYIERGGGQRELKTVVIFDSDGKEIRLLRNGASETGEYVGVVVYGRRSKIIVEYSGRPSN